MSFKYVIRVIAALGIATLSHNVLAQDPTAQGTAFANAMQPTQLGQIANPSAPGQWSANYTVPGGTPGGLGAFSNPTTDGSALASANTLGLSGLGNKAQIDCANYVPTGDPAKDNYCAAVNFMSNQCIVPNPTEAQFMGKAGVSTGVANNCQGTYGQGAATLNYSSTITQKDPIFAGTGNLTNQVASGGTVCTVQNIKGQKNYTYPTCQKTYQATPQTCNQTLNANCSVSTRSYYWDSGNNHGNGTSTWLPDPSMIVSATVSLTWLDDGMAFYVNGNPVLAANHSGPFFYFPTPASVVDFWDQWIYQQTDYCYYDDWGNYVCTTGYDYVWNPNFVFYEQRDGASYGTYNIKQYLVSGGNSFSTAWGGGYGSVDVIVNIVYYAYNCWSAWQDNCTQFEAAAQINLGTP